MWGVRIIEVLGEQTTGSIEGSQAKCLKGTPKGAGNQVYCVPSGHKISEIRIQEVYLSAT